LKLMSFLKSTQKILHHARLAEQGIIARDPMKESISLQLDMINILYVLSSSHSFTLLTLYPASALSQFSACARIRSRSRRHRDDTYWAACNKFGK
jgi:hypothetical protein